MSSLEQNTTKNGPVDKNAIKLDAGNNNNGKYKIKTICNNTAYKKDLMGYLLRFYFLIF